MSQDTERPRRVLMIVHDLPVPYDRRSWLEASSLHREGYTVSVICPADDNYASSHEVLGGIAVYRYSMPFEARGVLGYVAELAWCFLWTALLSLRVRFFGWGFDAIHSANPPDVYWILARAWRLAGVRFLFDHHDLSPEMYRAKFDRGADVFYRGLLWLEKMTMRTADVTLATNESYREIACGRGGRSAESVFIVRSGPDGERFQPRAAEPERKKGRRYLCCYLGKMCEQDGVDYLLRTVAILTKHRARSDIYFAVIGEGPALPELRRLATDLGIDENLEFTGYLPGDEVSAWLSTADLGVDPDPWNSWADRSTMNKVMDYMSFGRPVVGFDLTENRRSAGEAGCFVTPNSESELADAIEMLLADEARRQRMGEVGIKRVREELSWAHSEANLLSGYRLLFADAGAGKGKS